MCGYLRRTYGETRFTDFLKPYGLGEAFAGVKERPNETEHFKPAHAQHGEFKIRDIIIQENDTRKRVDATWWYSCSFKENMLVPWGQQTFNARNLDNPTWREPIETRRGIAVMSGIGESRVLDGRKTSNHYLMLADKPFFIGVLWKAYPQGLYSTAVITREKQIGFEKFHDKAFPLFLPYDKKFIDLWLDPEVPSKQPEIAELLAHPTWFCDLHCTRVKTFIRGELYKESVTETLKAA